MWGATYDEDDGWRYDHRWPGFARRLHDAWARTAGGDPAQFTHRSWGDYAGRHVELATWPTPSDVGLGVNVDWEPQYAWSQTGPRITAALHLGVVTVTLTWWRPFQRHIEPPRA